MQQTGSKVTGTVEMTGARSARNERISAIIQRDPAANPTPDRRHGLAHRQGRHDQRGVGWSHSWERDHEKGAVIRWYRRAGHSPASTPSCAASEQGLQAFTWSWAS
jgi:hypothetical protein